MSGPTGPWVLRRLASFLIRGPEAGFILADLDDAHERDVARGLPPWRARWRYALLSFTVAQRTREIGVRVALGARPRNIGYAIARHATTRLALGLALGGAFSAWVLAGLSEDPTMIQAQATWVVVVGAVAGTALVGVFACLVPTVRGLRVQPMEALAEG